jgi:hypothetical protein
VRLVHQREAADLIDRADRRGQGVDEPPQSPLARLKGRLVLLSAREQLEMQLLRALLQQLLLLAQRQEVADPGAASSA